MKKYIDMRVEANETDLIEFVRICGVIQFLGNIGASRQLEIYVDGDGSARFTFYMNEEKIPSTVVDTGGDKNKFFKFYLGE